jgi:SAM-dependent methyltransferase
MSGIVTGDLVKTRIQQRRLTPEDVLKGYDAVSQLYPHVPSLLLWRAWEYAAYQHYSLPEPVLDVGCGDGRYFRLVWPEIRDVIGVDMDPDVVEGARRSGVYRAVHMAPAHRLPVSPEIFASAFANCALEHMDHLDEVLAAIRRCLRPQGIFLLSVVTDKFLDWRMLSPLIEQIGEPERARALQEAYQSYHHLVNPFAPDVWIERLERAGFEVLGHTPIMPEATSRVFLLLDHLWHVEESGGKLGIVMHHYLKKFDRFPQGFRQIVAGMLEMERDQLSGSGAVFWAHRRTT